MKGIIEFDLPQEKEEFDMACNAQKYACILHDVDQFLRGKIKYETLDEKTYAAYSDVRSSLWQIINQYGVEI